jgi:hypothetical protein
VAEADVILHVRDVAHPDTAAQRADVIEVLDAMVADGTLDADWPARCIEVLNKADLLGGVEHVPVRGDGVAVSAITGEGLPALPPRSTPGSPRAWSRRTTPSPTRMAPGWPGCISTARCWTREDGAPAAGRGGRAGDARCAGVMLPADDRFARFERRCRSGRATRRCCFRSSGG